ncbi:oligogalacturonide lyase [Halogranum rubrum]|uniref:Oligogalacturonide lyase n=1 Tax=Halogranum rubrum TaxID=553466 RepID=A0A1I4GX12_9EURY|nr:oligogalacturonate lyase family protein [Halogranum rubrum]SFL33983.1 oligogalacturonide lyase [Halogranum rubrum]
MSEDLVQGPGAGREFPAEWRSYEDPETGARVTQLTDSSDGESWHLYFTDPSWYDDDRRLLVRSTRGEGGIDLYSIELATGEIRQLTDLPVDVTGVTCDPDAGDAYFWVGRTLAALDLDTLTLTALYDLPDGYGGSHAAVTADGERVVTAMSETVELERDDENRERWMEARMNADATSRVISVPVDGGDPTVHIEENRWLNHVNASPTRPELVTYCEEGIWEQVDRIWGLNLETNETWRIRPTEVGTAVGHEYWLADGEYVGYHGWRGDRDDPDAFFGQVRYDDTDRREAPAPDIYTHFHSNTRELVVGDGTYRGLPSDLVWRWDDDSNAYETPRKLVSHGWSGDADAHPHSRLSPDGDAVAFDSTRAGDGSEVYLVEIPDDLSDLPVYDDLSTLPILDDGVKRQS